MKWHSITRTCRFGLSVYQYKFVKEGLYTYMHMHMRILSIASGLFQHDWKPIRRA